MGCRHKPRQPILESTYSSQYRHLLQLLVEARKRAGMTQQQLADGAGISKPYLSQIETGKRKGTTEILSAIAKALDVSLDDVVERKM